MSNTQEFDLKRKEILDCAETLFTSKGYEDTTVNAILKEVGIAKGTFYYYFQSKEEVMDAVIMRFIDEDLQIAKTIMDNQTLSAMDKLLQCIFSKPKTDNKKVMIEQLYEANNALMKQRTLQRTIEVICPIYAQMIEEGNAKGEFTSKQPLEDIQFLIAGIQTLFDLSHIKGSTIEIQIESVVNAIFQMLVVNEQKNSKTKVTEIMIKHIKA